MLDSDWLIRMLEKSGSTPRDRLLALFAILDDWIDAPHMRQILARQSAAERNGQRLLAYLASQAQACGTANPDSLAHQLYFMAMGALHEELRTPGCGAMRQVKLAAETLMSPPAVRRTSGRQAWLYASSAAVLAMALGIGLLLPDGETTNRTTSIAPTAAMGQQVINHQIARGNPVRVAALYGAIEQMRRGVCQYPQALMLPAEQRSVYLENVVGGVISTDNRSPEELHQLVQKVECYYPPIAMTAS